MKNRIYLSATKPSYAIGKNYRLLLSKIVKGYLLDIFTLMKDPYAYQDKMIIDASNADHLSTMLHRISKKWQYHVNPRAETMSKHFIQAIDNHADVLINKDLSDALPVDVFAKMSIPMGKAEISSQQTVEALIKENVQLITNIVPDLHNTIHGIVMRGLSRGHDLNYITKELRKKTKFSEERIKFVARDQLFKATQLINNDKLIKIGIDKAIWKHSNADKVPRPDHLAAHNKIYDIKEGCLISGKYIQPAELINCTCYSVPFIEI